MFTGKKSAQIREILISESAWEEMTCLFAPSLSLFVGALIGVNILGIAVAAYVAVNTNKWFYEKEVKGLNTWSL